MEFRLLVGGFVNGDVLSTIFLLPNESESVSLWLWVDLFYRMFVARHTQTSPIHKKVYKVCRQFIITVLRFTEPIDILICEL